MIRNKQTNRLNDFRRGRVNTRSQYREQLVIRNNLEKQFYRKLNTLFRKFLNVQLYLYREFGLYEPQIASQTLNEDFFPLMQSHYNRVFKAVYLNAEDKFNEQKQETFVFGRSIDFEQVVINYFATRQLVLSNITESLANRISSAIEIGRSDNLTLQQIAKLVSDKFLPISRSRAALIARTETHNAASFASNSYHLQVQQDLGTKMLKQWVSANDERTRPSHSQASGQIVDMEESFIVGGVPMKYAGDSAGGAKNVVNCRCVIVYVDERDIIV